jgi:ankyrin repeat protein
VSKHLLIFILLFPLRGLGGFSFAQTDSLWQAVKASDLPKAQEAITKGADVNAQDENNAPILWWAALKGELPLVKYLVSKGANYQAQKGSLSCGDRCFYGNLTGIAAGENKLDLLQYLIEELKIPVDDKEWYPEKNGFVGWTALQWALNRKIDSIITYLLKKGASLDKVDKNDPSSGYESSLAALIIYDDRINPPLTSLDLALKNPLEITKLDLSSQGLKNLDPKIAQLKNLKVLKINSNQLKELPKEIGELRNLTKFECYSNQLTELPKEIGELKNLTEFSCVRNQLEFLPKEIGEL